MKKILVVDDDPRIRETFQYVLSTSGYESITVANITHAEQVLLTQPVHMVVSDLNLGDDESGLTLLKAIRKTNDTIPVIIFSGSLTPQNEAQLKEARANELLDKGSGIIPVMEKIGSLMAGLV